MSPIKMSQSYKHLEDSPLCVLLFNSSILTDHSQKLPELGTGQETRWEGRGKAGKEETILNESP